MAIGRAVCLRALHQDLADEFAGRVPPGQVWALVIRSARVLQDRGCDPDLVPVVAERVVRAALARRPETWVGHVRTSGERVG